MTILEEACHVLIIIEIIFPKTKMIDNIIKKSLISSLIESFLYTCCFVRAILRIWPDVSRSNLIVYHLLGLLSNKSFALAA